MDSIYNFEMVEVNFIKTIFIANLQFNTQERREIRLGIRLENRVDFDDYGLKARLVQSFKTDIPDDLSAPFNLEIEMGAFFTFPQPVPVIDRTRLVQQWLPRAAFPYLREHVAETTRRGGFPPLLLSPMLFNGPEDQTTAFSLNPGQSNWEH